jgi:hypothetical protein
MKLKKKISPEQFLAEVDQVQLAPINDLKALSLDELADRASSIVKQSNQLLARILLEGRRRFKSNKEYGQWVNSIIGLSDITFQHRNAMLNWAIFEETHPMDGISMTAGFEIASPGNADVAKTVYQYCYNKNLSVAEVKRYIMQLKSVVSIEKQDGSSTVDEQETMLVKPVTEQEIEYSEDDKKEEEPNYTIEQKTDGFYEAAIEKIFDELGLSDEVAIRILKKVIENRQNKLLFYKQTIK